MKYLSLQHYQNIIILLARILITSLFIYFGLQKILAFQSTILYMKQLGVMFPVISAGIAVLVELIFGLAILLGYYTRPLALLYACYSILTAIIGHQYWNLNGIEEYTAMIDFYKNFSIAGGCLLLVITGPGKYSLDRY